MIGPLGSMKRFSASVAGALLALACTSDGETGKRQCATNADCPQLECSPCPASVCVAGQCMFQGTGTGGATGSGGDQGPGATAGDFGSGGAGTGGHGVAGGAGRPASTGGNGASGGASG